MLVGGEEVDVSLNLVSLRCPHLLIAVIDAVRPLAAGRTVSIVADDLNAPTSISAWANQAGHTLLDLYDEDGRFVFHLRLGAHRSAQQHTERREPYVNDSP